jgi:hypothetical protein
MQKLKTLMNYYTYWQVIQDKDQIFSLILMHFSSCFTGSIFLNSHWPEETCLILSHAHKNYTNGVEKFLHIMNVILNNLELYILSWTAYRHLFKSLSVQSNSIIRSVLRWFAYMNYYVLWHGTGWYEMTSSFA